MRSNTAAPPLALSRSPTKWHPHPRIDAAACAPPPTSSCEPSTHLTGHSSRDNDHLGSSESKLESLILLGVTGSDGGRVDVRDISCDSCSSAISYSSAQVAEKDGGERRKVNAPLTTGTTSKRASSVMAAFWWCAWKGRSGVSGGVRCRE